MLLGVVGKSLVAGMKDHLTDRIGRHTWRSTAKIDMAGALILCDDVSSSGFAGGSGYWMSDSRKQGLFVEGEIFNLDDIESLAQRKIGGEGLWQLYKQRGPEFLELLNGDFVLALWNEEEQLFLLGRDKIGVREVFVHQREGGIVFGSHLREMVKFMGIPPEPDIQALMKYLTFCYNPGIDTFFNSIRRLRPAHFLRWKNGVSSEKQYWQIKFETGEERPEASWGEEIRERLTSAVKRRMGEDGNTGAFLSGGLDSSSVVSLLHREGAGKISTFSFRCKGESFDESPYAKIVADACDTEHTLVDYSPEDVISTREMTALMDEPFCDVGINVGTYRLAKAAEGKVVDLFTGDGGDELFAGHPVYVADRFAGLFGWIPRPVLAPFFWAGRQLKDSEKKKDWKVKIKRFSESYSYPKVLGTHRWRVYYHPRDLKSLISSDLWLETASRTIFEDVMGINEEAVGKDVLSRSLYSDYQTVVQFYLRRMDLARRLGLRPKLPMLDPDLVVFCAMIPSRLKIRGFSETKYIEKIAVEPLLPREVVHRTDKLGHSVPLKNWMRDNSTVKEFIFDLLSEETVGRRGYFDPDCVQTMIKEHMNKTKNHSHRLWALVVLELWLQSFES